MPHLRAIFADLLLLTVPGLLLRYAHTSSALCGRAGERLAERHLRRSGHRLLDRNLRHPVAELDLVTATSTHLVLVEVKTGHPGRLPLSARFTARARARHRLAAADLARRHGLLPRMDLIEVRLPHRGARVELRHFRGL